MSRPVLDPQMIQDAIARAKRLEHALPKDRYLTKLRRDAAEETCWSLILLMTIGALDSIDINERHMLGDPMQKWSDICVEQGLLKEDLDG